MGRIREYGCHFERLGRGDHEIWYSPITKRHFPVHAKILFRHTANAVPTQAGKGVLSRVVPDLKFAGEKNSPEPNGRSMEFRRIQKFMAEI